MLYLIGFVIASVLFNQALRYGQERHADILSVAAVNYALAAALTLGLALTRDVPWSTATTLPVLLAGAVNGVLFFAHIPFMVGSYRRVGVGITTAWTRTAIVIPAIVAWYAWSEVMGSARWAALALVPAAMFLMQRVEPDRPPMTIRFDGVLLACFVIGGLVLTTHKYADIHFSVDELEVYKVALFGAAAIASAAYTLSQQRRFTASEFRIGAFVGLCNAFGVLCVMLGLAVVPAVVFYPTSASFGIILNVLVAHWVWKERLCKRQVAGIGLAIAIVLLTNAPAD